MYMCLMHVYAVCTQCKYVCIYICVRVQTHMALCMAKDKLCVNITCLYCDRDGVFLVVFCCLCKSGWLTSFQSLVSTSHFTVEVVR